MTSHALYPPFPLVTNCHTFSDPLPIERDVLYGRPLITGDIRETYFLFQRLSTIIQCFNAVAFRRTFCRTRQTELLGVFADLRLFNLICFQDICMPNILRWLVKTYGLKKTCRFLSF